jgi:DnaJ-class molecular chaperone
MTDHYQVLGVEQGARQEEIAAAYQDLLAARRAKRQKTSDVVAAFAIVGDPTMRKAYDLAKFGVATSERIVEAKVTAVGFARDVVAEIDVQDLAHQAGQVVLKTLVLTSGATARVAEVTAHVSRAVQVAASRRLMGDV